MRSYVLLLSREPHFDTRLLLLKQRSCFRIRTKHFLSNNLSPFTLFSHYVFKSGFCHRISSLSLSCLVRRLRQSGRNHGSRCSKSQSIRRIDRRGHAPVLVFCNDDEECRQRGIKDGRRSSKAIQYDPGAYGRED